MACCVQFSEASEDISSVKVLGLPPTVPLLWGVVMQETSI